MFSGGPVSRPQSHCCSFVVITGSGRGLIMRLCFEDCALPFTPWTDPGRLSRLSLALSSRYQKMNEKAPVLSWGRWGKNTAKHLFGKRKWVFEFICIPTHSVITTPLRNPFTVTVKQEENMFIELSSWWVHSSGADTIFITPPIQFQTSLFFP